MHRLILFATLLLSALGLCHPVPAAEPTRILVVVGPTNHAPGTHEVAASGRLMRHGLEHMTNLPGVKADIFYEWPKNDAVLDAAATVVFIGDTFPPMRLPESGAIMRKLEAMMRRGCGIVCVHYATGLKAEDVAADGGHPLLHWMGGYFATRCAHHQSIAKIYPEATITPAAPQHPVWRGCREFTLHDEPYINNYFGRDGNQPAPNVTVLATAMLPPEAPKPETVSWCVERADGGRGFAVVMPHFYRNWKIEELRRYILNGIVWTAKLDVPADGVQTAPPDLAAFAPEALEPMPRATKNAARYNVLLIMADDLRPAMGCYGDAQARTPNLDRLAARGVRFERAYVQYPVCNPSRTSMLTGTRPETNGVTGNGTFFREKMPDIVTLPQLFRQHGAAAVSYGKIYHAGLVEGQAENRFLDAGKSWEEAKMFRATKLGNTGPRRNLAGGKLKWCEVADLEGGDDDQSDGQTAQQAIAAIERLAEKRWFIGAGFHRPHDPFVVNKGYVAQFPAGALELHHDPADATALLKHSLGGGAFEEAFAQFDDRDRMDLLTHYYAGATQTDAQVGRLMTAMDRLKLWEKTVVIFVGDHGYHLGERGWWNKNTLFDRSCRAPFLLVAPGVKPAVCRSLVEFLDIYPTVAELCGLAAPATVQGRSLRPLLDDPAQSIRESALTHIVRGPSVTGFSLRTDRWRYIEWSDGGVELYDHEADPGEWQNVAGLPAKAATLAEMKRQLAARR